MMFCEALMKLAILTTDTFHHAYFVREIARRGDDIRVLLEENALRPPFETAHPFEKIRDEDEADIWFQGGRARTSDFAETVAVPTVNETKAISALRDFGADAAVVFGTGRLTASTIAACPPTLLNLHGGDPEEYRGLDTHLWAIYHGDFPALITTLDKIAPRLDAGDIVQRRVHGAGGRLRERRLQGLDHSGRGDRLAIVCDDTRREGYAQPRPGLIPLP